MKYLLAILGLFLALLALGQPPPLRVVDEPREPSREALERLNLKLAWKTTVPTLSRRDGLFSVQVLPADKGTLLAVQTIAGTLSIYDGETGDLNWRVQLGDPYVPMQLAATNGKQIIACRRNRVYVLDRANGKHLVYDVDNDTGLPTFGFKVEGVPNAPLAADEDLDPKEIKQIYVNFGTNTSAYTLPNFEEIARFGKADTSLLEGAPPRSGLKPTHQPERVWNFLFVKQQSLQAPLVFRDVVAMVTSDGTLITVNRINGLETFSYQVRGPVLGKAAQHGNQAYVASEDYFLYALDVEHASLSWRLSTQSVISKGVEATDADVFVVPEKFGMTRVDRITEKAHWSSRTAQRLLAVNRRFVYAADRLENLLVLDYLRGTVLGELHHNYTVPVTNDLTDRIYLASQNGQILCLHHRDLPRPLRVKTMLQKAGEPKVPKARKEEPMPMPDKDAPDKDKMEKDKMDKDKMDKKEKGAWLEPNDGFLVGFLVPKLYLGTHTCETPFRDLHLSPCVASLVLPRCAKQSFAEVRSQTEFGNEANAEHEANADTTLLLGAVT